MRTGATLSLELMIPHYWNKTLLCTFSTPCESWGFLVGLVGIVTVPSLAWMVDTFISHLFWRDQVVSSLAYTGNTAEYLKGTLCRFQKFLLCVAFSFSILCPANSSCLYLPCLPTLHKFRESVGLCLYFFLWPCLGTLKAVSWENHMAYLICFSSLKHYSL